MARVTSQETPAPGRRPPLAGRKILTAQHKQLLAGVQAQHLLDLIRVKAPAFVVIGLALGWRIRAHQSLGCGASLHTTLHLVPVVGNGSGHRIAQEHKQPCLRHQGMHARHHHGRPVEVRGGGFEGTTAADPLFPKGEIGAIPALTAVVVIVEVVHFFNG